MRVVEEIRSFRTMPSWTPAIAGTPTSRAVVQSTLPRTPWVAVPNAAVKMIAASEVAVATFAS